MEKVKLRNTFLCIALFAILTSRCMSASAEEIENVSVSADETNTGVYIYYDLVDDDRNALFEITLKASLGEEEAFLIDEKALTGDVGPGISPGKKRRIHWDALLDRESIITTDAEFTVISRRMSESQIVKIPGRISVESFPDRADVYVDNKKVGETPLRNQMIPIGIHSITVKRSGFEKLEQKVTVNRNEQASVSCRLLPKSRWKVFTKSLIFPGSGQRYAEYRGKGNLITFLQELTIAGALSATYYSITLSKEYDDARDAYRKSKRLTDIESNAKKAKEKHDAAVTANLLQKTALGAAGGVYLLNLIDAYFTRPKIKLELRRGSLDIESRYGHGISGIYVSMRF